MRLNQENQEKYERRVEKKLGEMGYYYDSEAQRLCKCEDYSKVGGVCESHEDAITLAVHIRDKKINEETQAKLTEMNYYFHEMSNRLLDYNDRTIVYADCVPCGKPAIDIAKQLYDPIKRGQILENYKELVKRASEIDDKRLLCSDQKKFSVFAKRVLKKGFISNNLIGYALKICGYKYCPVDQRLEEYDCNHKCIVNVINDVETVYDAVEYCLNFLSNNVLNRLANKVK